MITVTALEPQPSNLDWNVKYRATLSDKRVYNIELTKSRHTGEFLRHISFRREGARGYLTQWKAPKVYKAIRTKLIADGIIKEQQQ